MTAETSIQRPSSIWKAMRSILFLIFALTSLSGQTTSTLLWMDDFQDGDMDGWLYYDETIGPSNWHVDGGYLVETSNIGAELRGTHAVAGLSSWEDYTLSVDLAITDDDYIGVVFRYQDSQNYYRACVSSQAGRIRLDKIENGVLINLDMLTMMWPLCSFNISVDVRGEAIKVFLNQQEYFDVSDTSFASGKVGVMSCYSTGSFFDKVEVYDELPILAIDPGTQITREPYLQSVLGDSAVIMWQTNRSSNSIVEYGLSENSSELVLSTTLTRNHEMVLRDLEIDTEYTYRIFSDTVSTDWSHFRSAPYSDQSFSFALLGDNRTNFIRHAEISAAISNETPDFLINVGDVVTYGPRPDWDTEFFNPMADLIETRPIYVSIGNHEKESQNFSKYFAFPDADHEHYYSFEYGNAFFIFIDNNAAAYPTSIYPSFGEESSQYQWLEEQLGSPAAQNAEWLFVFGHVPIYSVGTNNNYDLNRDLILPLLLDYEVDIYFAGHIHDYERGYSEGLHHIISGGGGGPLNHQVRDIPEIEQYEPEYHYCMIEVNGSVLGFQIKDKNQYLLDQFIISKTPSGMADDEPLSPQQLRLRNYPNPFNASTMVEFSIPQAGEYNITIYDILGRAVKILAEGYAQAGTYWLHWDGEDSQGILVPSGVYTCHISTESGSNQIKISYLK